MATVYDIVTDDSWGTWTSNNTISDGTTSVTIDASKIVWTTWTGYIGTSVEVGQVTPEYVQPSSVVVGQQQRQAEEQKRIRKEIRARARATLRRFLSMQQQKQLETERFFEILSRDGKRRYRIREGRSGNVRLLNSEGREVASYCAHPADYDLPDEDIMLTQKLMIEHNEQRFLDVANRSEIRRQAA